MFLFPIPVLHAHRNNGLSATRSILSESTAVASEESLNSTGDGLGPTGEGVPRGRFADRDSYLLHEDEESSRPERGAMDLARGPQVIGRQHEQEDVGEQRSHNRISMDNGEGPTRDGGDQQRSRRDEDEALVRWGIGTSAEGKKNERRKNQHVRHGDDVEEFWIPARRAGSPHEQISGRQNADNNHETRQHDACNAEAAMDVHASGGDQRSLRDEQEDPA